MLGISAQDDLTVRITNLPPCEVAGQSGLTARDSNTGSAIGLRLTKETVDDSR